MGEYFQNRYPKVPKPILPWYLNIHLFSGIGLKDVLPQRDRNGPGVRAVQRPRPSEGSLFLFV